MTADLKVGQVIDKIYRPFAMPGGHDVLTASISGLTSVVNISYAGIVPGWGAGTIIEIDREAMLVQSVDRAAQVATVVRDLLGTLTTLDAHAAGAAIRISPRFFRADILGFIQQAFMDMYPTVYRIGAHSFTYSDSKIGFDLPAGGSVFQIAAKVSASQTFWKPVRDWEVVSVPTTEFTSGRALMIYASLPNGSTVYVNYERPFENIDAEGWILEEDLGVPIYMQELPYYYAMSRVMAVEEIERSQSTSAQNHQRAQDVPPFSALRTGEWYKARYEELLKTCRHRLITSNPRKIGTSYGT